MAIDLATATDEQKAGIRAALGAVGQLDVRKRFQDVVAFSETPTFDFDLGASDNKAMTLTGNVTASTLTTTRAGEYVIVLIQDATGNWAFTWPDSLQGNPPQPDQTPGSISVYRLYFDGTSFHF